MKTTKKEQARQKRWDKQRVKRGYSDCDVWGFDYYLAKVISGGMKQLAENTISWPGEPMTFEEWQKMLMEISEAFGDYVVNETDFDCKPSDYRRIYKRIKKAFRLMSKHWGQFWD